jgi:hypothetical protein
MGEYINKWKLAHFQNAFFESGMISQEVQKPQNEPSLS